MTNSNPIGPLNVTHITDKQPAPACRFTITVSLSGFPVVIEGEGRAGDLKIIIDRLKAIGAEPPAAQVPTSATSEPTKKSAPPCPVHRTPMKASRKPGSWFCPRQTDDGGYCDEKA
jgi:hypothetical protein